MDLTDALDRLLAEASPLSTERVAAWEACGRVAAEDALAVAPVPHFPRAAMDGYLCHDVDLRDASSERPVRLRLTGAVEMGAPPGPGPARGEAWTIPTGGAVPAQGDRVVPLERARIENGTVCVERPTEGRTNISSIGETIAVGARVAAAGEVIAPTVAAALVACGVREVHVHRRVRVAVIATGSELADPTATAAPLPAGRVFNSNSIALRGMFEALNCAVEYRGIAPDEPKALLAALTALPDRYDLVISSGGVSVGRHDAVHRTWLELGARQVAGRVSLRPGGPFFAGRLGDAWVVGLSGTPVACLAAFHLLVQPLVRRLQGRRRAVRPVRIVRLAAAVPRASNNLRALWARFPNPSEHPADAEILTGAPGGDYASVIGATALVLLPAGTPALPAGARAPALLLDQEEDRDRLSLPQPTPGTTVIGVTGVSGSGKTTVLAGVVRRLTASGLRVAAVKHAAHGFALDRPGSDSARFAEAGARLVVLAGPDETVLRIAETVEDGDHAACIAGEAALAAWGAPPDVILVEGFQHPGRPVIRVGDQKAGAVGAALATISAVDDLAPDRLEPELDRVADCVRALLSPR